VRVGYVREKPDLGRPSYRLSLEKDRLFLQFLAVVDETTAKIVNNIDLRLVSGRGVVPYGFVPSAVCAAANGGAVTVCGFWRPAGLNGGDLAVQLSLANLKKVMARVACIPPAGG